jgi:hypothetical protein
MEKSHDFLPFYGKIVITTTIEHAIRTEAWRAPAASET